MYLMETRVDVIRIAPDRLGHEFEELAGELTRKSFEGKVDSQGGYTLVVRKVEVIDDGRIVHGDGAVYQKVRFQSLVYKPVLHEIIEGSVCEIMKFGAFIRFGPLDGLLHISQIMDDRIDVDIDNQRLMGKDTKRDIRLGDAVKARMVSMSINERSPRESKIGLTMRQPGLGKLDWLEEDRMKDQDESSDKGGKGGKGGKGSKKKEGKK